MVSTKEKREIGFMIAAVLVVALVGFGLQNMAQSKISANYAGAAVSIDSETPTYTGILYLLQEACQEVSSNGVDSCDSICESSDRTCVPLEENCDEISSEYACYCCGVQE